MSAVDTAAVSPDNPLRERVAAALRAAAVRRDHPRAPAARRCWPAWPSSGPRSPRSSARTSRPTFENTVVALERSGRLLSRAEAVFGNLAVVGVHAAAAGDRAGDRPAGGRALRRHAARPGAVRPDRRRARGPPRRRARRRGGAAGRALPPRLRAGRRAARRRRPGAGSPSSTRSSRRCRRRSGRTCSWPPRPPPCGSPTPPSSTASTPRRSPRRPTAAADRGRRRLPDHRCCCPTGQPVLDQAAQPRPAPAGVRGVGRAGRPSGEHDNRPVAARIAAAAGRAGPAARLRHPRRPRPRRLRPRAPPRPSTRCWARWCPRRWPTPRPRPRCSPRRPPATASSSRPGTGRSTASRCAPSGTPSTPPRCGPYFELDRVLVDGVFHAAELLYGFRFTPRPDLRGYHPDVRVWEVSDADGAAVGLYLGDFFAREGKRGGAWMSSFVRQSRLLGTPAGRGQQPQRVRGRRPASRRC